MIWGFHAILVSLLSATSYHALELNANRVDRYELEPRLTEQLTRFASAPNLEESLNYGQMVVEKSKRAEGTIIGGRDRKIGRGGTAYAQLIDGYPTPDTERQDHLAGTVLRASSYFVNRFCVPSAIPSYECGLFLSGVALPESSALYTRCRTLIEAKEHNDQYLRLLPAVYDDGVYSFRRSVTGQELPSARLVSSRFHTRSGGVATGDDDYDLGRHTAALVQWSQFIEHDLAKTTVQTMHDGADIECCTTEHGPLLPRYRHPAACAPIPVPVDDPFYREHRATCLNYVRSARSLGDSCQLGPANQLNAATAHLDLSQLYGSTVNESVIQRTHQGGRLRAQQYDSLDYLPAASGNLCVTDAQLETICYSSGDSRVNVNPYVTLLHTLFLRSHNRLAKHLALVAPRWTDEQLFTVARYVNIRIYRKIVREWLTTITGPIDTTRSTLFDQTVVGKEIARQVSNEFATAAIRFYHTMMPGTVGNVPLQTLFYRPKDLRKRDYFRQVVDSVLHQNAMALDTAYVDDVAHLLFGATRQIGLDVLALDIQRGRDHGLARYVDYYALCNGDRIDDWSQLAGVMRPEDLEILRTTYARVEDVDLIVGGVAERPKAVGGAIVGPTFSCLIREQIERSFNLATNVETGRAGVDFNVLVDGILKDYGAARFMCDTAQVDRVQRDIFRLPSPVDNPSFDCSQLPSLDLTRLVQTLDAAGGWPQLRPNA
ncbi:peroxidase-like [Anopheles darlingi]|uniref:peroxidase-like n=1 Tax=Anopheles darlingi TaxID=43151 RepID=UPI00210020F2|nr:peroxidase-like [Anopheles darlingi]